MPDFGFETEVSGKTQIVDAFAAFVKEKFAPIHDALRADVEVITSPAGGNWKIEVKDAEFGTGAEVDVASKKLYVSGKRTPQEISEAFVFELGNALAQKEYMAVKGGFFTAKPTYTLHSAGRKKSDIEAGVTALYAHRMSLLVAAGYEASQQVTRDLAAVRDGFAELLQNPKHPQKLAAFCTKVAEDPHTRDQRAPAVQKLPTAEMYAIEMPTSASSLSSLQSMIGRAVTSTQKDNLKHVETILKAAGNFGTNEYIGLYAAAVPALAATGKFTVTNGYAVTDTMTAALETDRKALPEGRVQAIQRAIEANKSKLK